MSHHTLQFVTSRALDSWIIRYGTWSDFSHVDLVCPDGRLLGARVGSGVQIRRPDYGTFSRIVRYRVPVSTEIYFRVLEFCYAQVGKSYDWSAILNFFVRRDWREDDSWFCSELIAAAFERAGHPLLNPDIPYWRITPRDIMASPFLVEAYTS